MSEDEIAAMTLLTDDALGWASDSSLTPKQQCRLYQLTQSGKDRRLTQAEVSELDKLLEQYDIAVLRRAHALAQLLQRGYCISNQNNYMAWRDETLGQASVDSLYEEIAAFQEQKVNKDKPERN